MKRVPMEVLAIEELIAVNTTEPSNPKSALWIVRLETLALAEEDDRSTQDVSASRE